MADRTALRHFLLVFDHRAGELLSDPSEFDDVNAAVSAYEEAEERFDQSHDVEVVLIGSDSLDTVKQTHANYFDGTAALARALAIILKSAEKFGESSVSAEE